MGPRAALVTVPAGFAARDVFDPSDTAALPEVPLVFVGVLVAAGSERGSPALSRGCGIADAAGSGSFFVWLDPPPLPGDAPLFV